MYIRRDNIKYINATDVHFDILYPHGNLRE